MQTHARYKYFLSLRKRKEIESRSFLINLRRYQSMEPLFSSFDYDWLKLFRLFKYQVRSECIYMYIYTFLFFHCKEIKWKLKYLARSELRVKLAAEVTGSGTAGCVRMSTRELVDEQIWPEARITVASIWTICFKNMNREDFHNYESIFIFCYPTARVIGLSLGTRIYNINSEKFYEEFVFYPRCGVLSPSREFTDNYITS